MKIIDRIFRGGSTVTATATPAEQPATEQELTARLAEVQAQISGGEGDVALALEEKEKLTRQIQAARIKREQAANRAHREGMAAKIADYDKRVDVYLIKLNDAVAKLLFTLQDGEALIQEAYKGGGNGRTFEEMFAGLSHTFPTDLRRAIAELAPVEWDFGACLPGGKGGRPTPRTFMLKMPSATDVNGRIIGSTTYI